MPDIKSLRNELGYTQQELAEKALLSLRTIQRIESGEALPKGHTLKALAKALSFEPKELILKLDEVDDYLIKSKIRVVNLSALAFLVLPFGNVLLPLIVWKRTKSLSPTGHAISRQIVYLQLCWSVSLCMLLILSLFIQAFFSLRFSFILLVLFICIFLNLIFIAWATIQINKGNYPFFKSRT